MFYKEKWANSIVKIDTSEGIRKNPTKITVFENKQLTFLLIEKPSFSYPRKINC